MTASTDVHRQFGISPIPLPGFEVPIQMCPVAFDGLSDEYTNSDRIVRLEIHWGGYLRDSAGGRAVPKAVPTVARA